MEIWRLKPLRNDKKWEEMWIIYIKMGKKEFHSTPKREDCKKMPAKSLREPTSHPLIIKTDDYEEIVKKDFSNISLF